MTIDEERKLIAREAIHDLINVDPIFLDNPAIVFDIDDTLIDSITSKTIVCIRDLYHVAQDLQIPIFIITARDPRYRRYTERQLKSCGISGYQELLMIPFAENQDRGIAKAQHRAYIESLGYSMLMNIGDDPQDFVEDTSIFRVKLPTNNH